MAKGRVTTIPNERGRRAAPQTYRSTTQTYRSAAQAYRGVPQSYRDAQQSYRSTYQAAPQSRSARQPARRPARRKARGGGVRMLLYILSAALLLGAVGLVLWHTLPSANAAEPDSTAVQNIASQTAAEPADNVATAAVDTRIVVAVDPGHGGVNPNQGVEDYGSEYGGRRESEITHAVAQLLYSKLEADGRFAPVLTADGSAYLKPSERGAVAKAAGAQLLVSVHLNYDSTLTASGFECYAATPNLSTNADSVRFGSLLATAFGDLGLSIRGDNGVRYLYYGNNDERIVTESYDTTPRSDATFTVLEACGCPAVLCEMGFISSTGDMAILAGDAGNEAAAETLYQCILQYFNLT